MKNMLRAVVMALRVGFLIPLLGLTLASQNIPEFYGIYIVANNKLIELKPNNTTIRFPTQNGMQREHVQGLASLSGIDLSGDNFYIIYFAQNASINRLQLTKLVYRNEMSLKVKMTGAGTSEYMTRVNLWVKETDVPFRVAPIEGRSGMYKIAPESDIGQGVYAVHFGSIWTRMTDVFGAKFSGFDSGNSAYDFTFNYQREAKYSGLSQAPTQAAPLIPKMKVSIPSFASSEAGLREALEYALSALQERKRATAPSGKDIIPTEEEKKAWNDMTAASLDRALESLAVASNLANTLSIQNLNELTKNWQSLIENAKKLLYSNKPFTAQTSLSRQKKVIKELKNYLSPKK